MIHYTQNRKSRPYKAILFASCAFILVFSIGFGVLSVEASNPYISDINYYTDADGIVRVKFFVNTSFEKTIGPETGVSITQCKFANYGFGRYTRPTDLALRTLHILPIFEINQPFECDRIFHFVAGNTYDMMWSSGSYINLDLITKIPCTHKNTCNGWDQDFYAYYGIFPASTNYITDLFYWAPPEFPTSEWPENALDTEFYYFSEVPSLNITFPLPNAEIAEAFDITGTYTIPSIDDYYWLVFELQYGDADMIWAYKTDLIATSGSFSVRVAGLPAGNYTIRPHFFGALGWYYTDEIPISVVDTIPIELPETQEQPPEQFGVVEGDIFYPEHSNYPEPTNLYENLISAIQPIFIVIGDNLTFFSSKFSQDTAKETGAKTGEAILLMRAYASNLNTFFSDLPISEFLFFYLTLLVVVIVFRTIKNLINLIKP